MHSSEPVSSVAKVGQQGQSKKVVRTRTGCVTCKSRRIKCDETKPKCLRCVKSGRECLGYNAPKAWIFEPRDKSEEVVELAKPESSGSMAAQLWSPHGGMPLREPESPRLQHLLQRFFIHTVPANALFGNRDLWTRLFPQLLYRDVALKHLGVALATITDTHSHQALITGIRPGPNDNIEYFAHVDKALRRILDPNSSFPPALMLPCCLFLALAESLRTGGPFPSMQHVRAGIGIINMYKIDKSKVSGDPSEWSDIIPTCSPAFGGLVRRARALGQCENLIETTPWLQKQQVDLSHVPSRFEDLVPAAFCLDAITSFWVMPFMSEDDLETNRDPSRVEKLLGNFSTVFTAFETKRLKYAIAPEERAKIALVRAGYYASTIIAQCYPTETEMVFDNVTELFAQIVKIFKQLFRDDEIRPILCSNVLRTSTGRIMPLFLTATKCRDYEIRTQALKLLSVFIKCSEATWNGRTARRIADAVLSIETWAMPAGVSNHVPENARIRLVFAAYEPGEDHSLHLGYTRFPHNTSSDCVIKVPLRDPEDITAADDVGWPLVLVLQSFGYQGVVTPIVKKNMPIRIDTSKSVEARDWWFGSMKQSQFTDTFPAAPDLDR